MSCKILSPLGSCGALLYGGPQSSVNNGILIPEGVPTLDNFSLLGGFILEINIPVYTLRNCAFLFNQPGRSLPSMERQQRLVFHKARGLVKHCSTRPMMAGLAKHCSTRFDKVVFWGSSRLIMTVIQLTSRDHKSIRWSRNCFSQFCSLSPSCLVTNKTYRKKFLTQKPNKTKQNYR